MKHFSVAVIGGGHAGIEAAAAAARMGVETALVTHRFEKLGEMSCNPAIGGLGKGHLVREIDALDGLMGQIGDRAAIQYRLLNRSKGPAVQGPRSQIDRELYKNAMQARLSNTNKLEIIEGEVTALQIEGIRVTGIIVNGEVIRADRVVLATGTFLGGVIHVGDVTRPAGRVGDPASNILAAQLRDLGLPIGRLKTGTPPRLVSKTIDWKNIETQQADTDPVYFSTLTDQTFLAQISCGVTQTNLRTHEIIGNNLHKSAMYSGNITGQGPRYCPSIEDKITRFADRDHHQIFLEPEGLNSPLVYPNGISTSLPEKVQLDYVRSIQGLERVEIAQYGYAIEYDYIDPRTLRSDLSLKNLENIYFAGQINGTTGYEEAAAQGLVAGLNAALSALGRQAAEFHRYSSYIGVMIDDLITRGVTEPYRMFTSRAEYRLSIRADNADQRLTEMGINLGLVQNQRRTRFYDKKSKIDSLIAYLGSINLTPNEIHKLGIETKLDGQRRSLYTLLSFPRVDHVILAEHYPELLIYDLEILNQVKIEASYAGYIERQNQDIEVAKRDLHIVIPEGFDFFSIPGLSNELSGKLSKSGARNFSDMNRIEGMTPAALSVIAAFIRRESRSRKCS